MAKKALILTVALLCAFAVPAMAQKKASTDKKPTPVAAAAHSEVSDFGVRWQAMSDKEREGFLRGMATAFRVVCLQVAAQDGKTSDPAELNKRFMECFISTMPYQPNRIKDAMTSLYQDKANNHIPYDMLYSAALLKAGDKPYEENLVQMRKVAAKIEKNPK